MPMSPLWSAWVSEAATREPYCISPISLMALLSTLTRILTKFAYALPRVPMFIEVGRRSSTITHGTLYLTFKMDAGHPWSCTCDRICNKHTVFWRSMICGNLLFVECSTQWIEHTVAFVCASSLEIEQASWETHGGKLWLPDPLGGCSFSGVSDHSHP